MLRQQLAALLLLAACALPVSAQQVFINSMYVMRYDSSACELAGTRFVCPCALGTCPIDLDTTGIPLSPTQFNISNEPHIEFEAEPDGACPTSTPPSGVIGNNVCNKRVMLCCAPGWSNTQT